MNHADMKLERILWRANINTHSVHIDTAAVRVINAGKHIHQSRFAASVFTQKGQNLSLANVQRNVFVCSYCAEMLGYVNHADCEFGIHLLFPFCAVLYTPPMQPYAARQPKTHTCSCMCSKLFMSHLLF